MEESYDGFVQQVVMRACESGEVVDTAAIADAVIAQFLGVDRRAVVETVLSAVVWAHGNASIGR